MCNDSEKKMSFTSLVLLALCLFNRTIYAKENETASSLTNSCNFSVDAPSNLLVQLEQELKNFYEKGDNTAVERYANRAILYHGGNGYCLRGFDNFLSYVNSNRKNWNKPIVNIYPKCWSEAARILLFDIHIVETSASALVELIKELTWRFDKKNMVIEAWMDATGIRIND
jgi:hypothetical protein